MDEEFQCSLYNTSTPYYANDYVGRSHESLNINYPYHYNVTHYGGAAQPPPYIVCNDDPYYRRMSNPDIAIRRNSFSLSNDQLQQIHFDPRIRDCRSSSLTQLQNRTRSNSLNSLGKMKPQFRYDTPPSIYIEEWNDSNSNASNKSNEFLRIEESGNGPFMCEIKIVAPTPSDSSVSLAADVDFIDDDDIPFIDDDDDDNNCDDINKNLKNDSNTSLSSNNNIR